MLRTFAVALAVTLLIGSPPAPADAQQPAQQAAAAETTGTHEVVEGNTLWDLAAHFYNDPWLWPRIWEANRDRVEDPDLIFPHQVLRIPDLETGQVREVIVVAPGDPAAQAPDPDIILEAEPRETFARGPRELGYRTSMWRDTTPPGGIMATDADNPLVAVPRDVMYSARWLVRLGETPGATGALVGFSGAEGDLTSRRTARPYERVLVELDGPLPPLGSRLQVFRPEDHIDALGDVMLPTGVVTVVAHEPPGVVALVETMYAHLAVGDLVRPLPPHEVRAGVVAQPVTNGPEVQVLAYGQDHPAHSIGDIGFLDHGRNDGLRVGDEFVVVWSSAPGWSGEVEGRLQVVSLTPTTASARITQLRNPVFVPGIRVRMDRRLP